MTYAEAMRQQRQAMRDAGLGWLVKQFEAQRRQRARTKTRSRLRFARWRLARRAG